MSQSDGDPQNPLGGHAPTTQIHQAHQYALRARQNYVSVSMSNADDRILKHAHHQLNRAVLRYLEAMKYLLRTKDSISTYWEGKPPKKPGAPFEDGDGYLYSEQFDGELTPDDLTKYKKAYYDMKGVAWERVQTAEPGDDDVPEYKPEHLIEQYKQRNNLRPVDRVRFSKSDRHDGYDVTVVVPRYGLRRLEKQWQQRRPVRETRTGMLGTRTIEREQPDLLPAEVLINAGTALDEAADALGLLAEVERSVPRTDISEDMLEDVRKWHQQNFGEDE